MKLLKAILLGSLVIQAALATIAPGVVYEVRTTGSDANGGGFVCSTHTLPCVGGTGTDWSQQAAAQYALTALTTSGASATVLTSSASADMVNNIAQITGGTNFIQAGAASTTSFYQIVSQVTGVSVTLDRAATTGSGSAGTMNIGGALLSPAIAAAQTSFYSRGSNGGNAGGNTSYFSSPVVFIQYSVSPFTITTATPNVAGGIIEPNNAAFFVGYDTSGNRFIGNTGVRPTIQAQISNISMINQIASAEKATFIMNLIIDGNSGGGFTGVIGINNSNFTQYGWLIWNVKAMNCALQGIYFGNLLIHSEITNCGSGIVPAVQSFYGGQALYNWIHNNPAYGFFSSGPAVGNIVSNNGQMGIVVKAYGQIYMKNIVYGNASDGINTSSNDGSAMYGNVEEGNGGYGINDSGNMQTWVSYNSSFNNTLGAFNKIYNPMNAGNLTPAASVFVNAAGNNFTPNSTAGGLALRAALALFNSMPDGLTTGFVDIGLMQHKDSAGPNPITVH